MTLFYWTTGYFAPEYWATGYWQYYSTPTPTPVDTTTSGSRMVRYVPIEFGELLDEDDEEVLILTAIIVAQRFNIVKIR